MRHAIGIAGLVLWAVLAAPFEARASERVALVIGNSAYQHVPRLANAVNDAQDMAAALARLGFAVEVENNLTYEAMRRAMLAFGDRAAGAAMAFLFYAGHGMEIGRQNHFIPVDARLATDRSVAFEAVPIDLAMAAVEGAGTLRVVLLDACRNNLFAAQMKVTNASRSLGRGLARIEPSAGTLVGFAAREGTTAEDGAGRNSPFTKALLANLEQPGIEVNLLFRKVRDDVLQATGGRQEPFVYGSLPGTQIYFVAPPQSEPPPQPAAAQGGDDAAVELTFWNSVKDAHTPAYLNTYLQQYPRGRFAALARAMLDQLAAAATPPANQPQAQPKPPAGTREGMTKTAAVDAKAEPEGFRLNGICRSWLGKFKGGHLPHAAFAAAQNGSCGWSAGGQPSVGSAIAQALSECRKQHPVCRIVATK